MKVKEMTLGVSYTYQPAPYHSIKGEASLVVELDEDESISDVEDEVREKITDLMLKNLAGVGEIHTQVHDNSDTPMNILTSGEDTCDWDDWDDEQ